LEGLIVAVVFYNLTKYVYYVKLSRVILCIICVVKNQGGYCAYFRDRNPANKTS